MKQQHIGPWSDDGYDGVHWEDDEDGDNFFKWYHEYKKTKA